MTTRVNALRRALGDSGRGQRLIRTLPRKGLRFVGEVMPTKRGAAPALVRSTAFEALRPAASERACVAIVGLAHRAADRDVAAFAHALSRSLVAALGAFRWFSVKAPPVPHLPTPLPSELAGPLQLDARYAFGGSVVRRGRHLSVTLHLKLAATGLTLWEDRCEGPLGAAALADRIALAASASMEPQLRAAEARHAAALTDPAATPYALHLQAHPIFSDGRATPPPRHIRHDSPRRERLGNQRQLLLRPPAPTTLRTHDHAHLGHAVQLRALLRTHLRAQPLKITPSVTRRPPPGGYQRPAPAH
jgi:TolB-like protein